MTHIKISTHEKAKIWGENMLVNDDRKRDEV